MESSLSVQNFDFSYTHACSSYGKYTVKEPFQITLWVCGDHGKGGNILAVSLWQAGHVYLLLHVRLSYHKHNFLRFCGSVPTPESGIWQFMTVVTDLSHVRAKSALLTPFPGNTHLKKRCSCSSQEQSSLYKIH